MIEDYVDFDAHPEIEPLAGLIQCAACKTRTLPRIAAAWPEGKCDFCQDPDLRALVYGAGTSDGQRQLEDQGQREKRKQAWEARQPAEPAPPDPNQLKLVA